MRWPRRRVWIPILIAGVVLLAGTAGFYLQSRSEVIEYEIASHFTHRGPRFSNTGRFGGDLRGPIKEKTHSATGKTIGLVQLITRRWFSRGMAADASVTADLSLSLRRTTTARDMGVEFANVLRRAVGRPTDGTLLTKEDIALTTSSTAYLRIHRTGQIYLSFTKDGQGRLLDVTIADGKKASDKVADLLCEHWREWIAEAQTIVDSNPLPADR